MRSSSTINIIIACLLSAAPAYSAFIVDFNTPGDLENNFSTLQTVGLATESPTGGLLNSGRMNLSTLSASQVWTLDQSFSGDLASWSVSLFLQGQYLTFLGVTSDPTPLSVGGLAGATPSLARAQMGMGSGSLNGGTLGFRNSEANVATVAVVNSTTVVGGIPSGWLHYSLTVDYLGSNEYELRAMINQADANGTIGGNLADITSTVTNASLASDPSVYMMIGLGQTGTSIDNFSTTAIPEPSVALLGSLTCLGLVRRRR